MSSRVPNGMMDIIQSNHKSNYHKRDDANKTSISKQSISKSNSNDNNAAPNQHQQQQQGNTVLNVAEMLLHGVADHEILDIWLRSIVCPEYAKNFVDAGYDMPTISRITPQDLTAIGITDPTKRLKILSEIKKLNLHDGLPTFRPVSLGHWLSLLRLDSHYHKLLCDQQIDTTEKACQLTWEDLEELGITKLGHQKRLLLAIERLKDIDSQEAKSKPLSEPIYDTNPSQILLIASAENHSMNGPIINKQSSTSELSSTGSGSMHSLYSANSIQYQPTHAALPGAQQHGDQQMQQHNQPQKPLNQTQAIYGQLPPQPIKPPQKLNQSPHHNQMQPAHQAPQYQSSSHYQSTQPITNQSQFKNSIYDTNNLHARNTMVPLNRNSLGQLPFALANLPKHQQQILQQSSIYATLSRQPQRAKQPPPPVPIRTNSLKTNSLIDEEINERQTPQSNSNQTNSTSSLYRSGTRVSNKNQYNSHTLLTKNKSFSGNAYMDAARARFLNRNSQQLPHIFNLPQQMQAPSNGGVNNNQNVISNTANMPRQTNWHMTNDVDNLSVYSRQSIPASLTAGQTNPTNHTVNDTQLNSSTLFNQQHSTQLALTHNHNLGNLLDNQCRQREEYDVYSDTNSTKSLILSTTNGTNEPSNNNCQTSLSQESGSSQTLYNSASSGSTDHNLNTGFYPQSGNITSCHSTTSNSTLNDINLILDQQVAQQQRLNRLEQKSIHGSEMNGTYNGNCNATTGKDDDFPPPPSPLVLTDSDERDLHSINPEANFNDLSQRLMTFRVGI